MFENIGTGLLSKMFPGLLKQAWEPLKNKRQKSKNASHDYNKPYKKRHGQLHVTCVGMEAQRSLDDVYVAVQFLEKRRAAKHRSTEDIEKELRGKGRGYFTSTSDKRQGGMRVANDEQYLMVLGGPGVGKSTFLRKVGLEALKKEDGDFEHQCIPVFLELKRFTEDPIDIEAWITEEFKICGYPYPEKITNTVLESGELLVLFDGLDEIPEAKVNHVINKFRDFIDQYSENRFIVSCRSAAYTGTFTGFTVVEMANFDDSQIQDYINNWFASVSNRKMKTAQRCWQALNDPDHQAIKALAQNPLSLALLCTIYEDSQDFSSNRAILYGKILNIFLKKWTAEKQVRRDPLVTSYLGISTVKEFLSEIAAENFKANRLVFSEDELTDQIQEFYQWRTDISSEFDASGVLEAILVDPGLFVERANGVYSFFHLTFQEYLTANHIAGDKRSIQDLVERHLHDEQWREVFLLTAGLMREADDLLKAMEAKAAKLINTPRLKALFQWAERRTDTSNDRNNGIAKRSFALYQYFSLHLLNEIYKAVENIVNHDLDLDRCLDLYFNGDLDLCLYFDIYRDRYLDLYINREFNRELDLDLDLYHNRDLYRDLYRELDLYLYLYLDLDLDLCIGFYQDFYRYMDAKFYSLVFDEFGDRFDEELQERITLVKRMEQMKIIKGVDLRQMIRRFNEQREFIKAAAARGDVKPPAKSIHDTWLSVLNITDEMLDISRGELETYFQYLRAVDLITACKEAAGRVSPDVWQRIEDRLFTWGAEESED